MQNHTLTDTATKFTHTDKFRHKYMGIQSHNKTLTYTLSPTNTHTKTQSYTHNNTQTDTHTH